MVEIEHFLLDYVCKDNEYGQSLEVTMKTRERDVDARKTEPDKRMEYEEEIPMASITVV